jgi:DNA-binding PadR family transcriptional regulator
MRARTLTEWVVLGVLAEAPAHGFAVARLLERGGEIGRVWSASRPLTYRSVDQLASDGLVVPVRTEVRSGPQRTVLRPSPRGRRALQRWLAEPVLHFRDVRATLLVKLLLLERRDHPADSLLAAQRKAFAPLLADAEATTADDVVSRWRREQAAAIARFLGVP